MEQKLKTTKVIKANNTLDKWISSKNSPRWLARLRGKEGAGREREDNEMKRKGTGGGREGKG